MYFVLNTELMRYAAKLDSTREMAFCIGLLGFVV
jgi:hypothetical protein